MNDQSQEENGNQRLAANICWWAWKSQSQCYRLRAHTLVDARSYVNDDCFDLPTFANRKIQSEKQSDLEDFASSPAKTAALYKHDKKDW